MNMLQLNRAMEWEVQEKWKYVYGTILFVSQVVSMLIPIIYVISKKSRDHPAQIILMICLLEMISTYQLFFWSISINDVIWFLYLDIIVDYYTFGLVNDDLDSYLCWWNQTLFFICVFGQISYYIILSGDLILTLKKPFINSGQRLIWYHLMVCTIATIAFLFTKFDDETSCQISYLKVEYTPLVILQCVFLLVSIISIYFGVSDLIRTRKQSEIIKNTKRRYFTQHLFLIFALLIIWMPIIVNNIIEINQNEDEQDEDEESLLNQDEVPDDSSLFVHLCFCILLAHPIIISIIRLSDPYFKYRVRMLILQMFGKITKAQILQVQMLEMQANNEMDQWMVPLSQILSLNKNQETVENILYSILQVTRGSHQNIIQASSITQQEVKKLALQIKSQFLRNITDLSYIRNSEINTKGPIYSPLMIDGSQSVMKQLDYKIYEYAGDLFNYIRRLDNIDEEIMLQSLNPNFNLKQIKKTQRSLGKSGSFFFFSNDKRFILKTIVKSELDTLVQRFLPTYFQYIRRNQHSLLSRIYGIYTLDVEGISSIHLILMENSLQYMPKQGLRLYDLKGSLVNRNVPQQKSYSESDVLYLIQNNQVTDYQAPKSDIVGKDINFLQSQDIFVELGIVQREELMEQVKLDADFLKYLDIMDYSLLLGVKDIGLTDSLQNTHIREQGPSFKLQNKFRRLVSQGKVYSFSIIDILQSYDFFKQVENKYKALTKEESLISCVSPDYYKQRFISFINSIIISVNNG